MPEHWACLIRRQALETMHAESLGYIASYGNFQQHEQELPIVGSRQCSCVINMILHYDQLTALSHDLCQERNVYGMDLVAGIGNPAFGPVREHDHINRVYIVDSMQLPFHKAEIYHQYHNGIGASFGSEYLRDQKRVAQKSGRIGRTGCPEFGLAS